MVRPDRMNSRRRPLSFDSLRFHPTCQSVGVNGNIQDAGSNPAPTATYYRPMKLNEARDLALRLMEKHGVSDWTFEFDRAKKRFGCCNYTFKRISLSISLTELNDEDKVRDTILHEIAHALVGHKHNHNHVWRRKAIEIGCNGERCYSSDKVVTPVAKYHATCEKCNKTYKRYRIPKYEQSCGRCSGGRFNPEFIIKWKRNENM